MFNRSVPGFHRLDSDLLGRVCSAAEGDELADCISWSQTQGSSKSSGVAQAPAHVSKPAPVSHNPAPGSDEEILPPSIEDSSPALPSSQLVQDPSQDSPVVCVSRHSRLPAVAQLALSSALPNPDPNAPSPVLHRPSVATSTRQTDGQHVGNSRAARRIFHQSATGTTSTSGTTHAQNRLTAVPTSTAASKSVQTRSGRPSSPGSELEDSPPPVPRLSPVLGTQRSPVLRPSRSPVLRPTRRLRPATETVQIADVSKNDTRVSDAAASASKNAAEVFEDASTRVAEEATGMFECATEKSKSAASVSLMTCGGSKSAPSSSKHTQPEIQPRLAQLTTVGEGPSSAGSSPVIERRRRRRARPNSTSGAGSAAHRTDDATRTSTDRTDETPMGVRPAAGAVSRAEDATPLCAPDPALISPAVTRRSLDKAPRRPGPVRQLFPAFEASRATGVPGPFVGRAASAGARSSMGSELPRQPSHESTNNPRNPENSREASNTTNETSMTGGDRSHVSTPRRPAGGSGGSRCRHPSGDTAQTTKRRRTLLSVDEELRSGPGREPEPVPTVSSQERLRWLRAVTGADRTVPQATATDRRASDFVRQLRRSEVTPEKAAAEPEVPPSGRKLPPKRRGLVQRLRRVLKRSGAFVRMSRHRTGGAPDQGCLRVFVERCERQAGARMVLGRTPDPDRSSGDPGQSSGGPGRPSGDPGEGPVQVLLANGADLPAVSAGDTLLLHPPWQRLQVAEGPPVLLPIGGASVEPGPSPPPPPVVFVEFTCPCPDDAPLPAQCLRPFPRTVSPSRQPLTQSHLTTVREAVSADCPLDDTTILSALGCGGDVVNTIDATVLHVCQYRCPADSQTSDGPEEDWCWSLLVRDGAGTVAEVVVPAPLVRRYRPLVRSGIRLRLTGLVVRERTTSDQHPALASMVVRLTGSADPGFTYILQALSNDSQLTELPGRTVSAGGDPGLLPELSSVENLPHSAQDPPVSTENLPRSALDPPSPTERDPCDPSPWCYSTLAGEGGPPPAAPDCRLDLPCRLLAPLDGAVLVLTADGPLRLEVQSDAALMMLPGQTALLRHVWRRDARMTVDRYSSVERRDAVTVPPPGTPLPPLTASAQPDQLVLVSGQVAGVDEQCASVWPACSECGSDDLADTSSGQMCHFCCLPPPSVVNRMELKVEVACPGLGRSRVFVQLLQSTIESLLGRSSGDPDQGYELSSVLGLDLTDLCCVVTSRQAHTIGLHQIRL
ncbi:uncharacterized protein LOC122381578 [Amphibalanus amphitrite]|uniref:uncharacterized protein LOC122381578 n=1 Tax=Amphibalanus amphitrite TaxID=1232801 RepID=UPI001C908CE8|nr:uncharacterized protein LOC122381578 [Amphibalanus amphitrite]